MHAFVAARMIINPAVLQSKTVWVTAGYIPDTHCTPNAIASYVRSAPFQFSRCSFNLLVFSLKGGCLFIKMITYSTGQIEINI